MKFTEFEKYPTSMELNLEDPKSVEKYIEALDELEYFGYKTECEFDGCTFTPKTSVEPYLARNKMLDQCFIEHIKSMHFVKTNPETAKAFLKKKGINRHYCEICRTVTKQICKRHKIKKISPLFLDILSNKNNTKKS
jgi:hypothetical protein